MSAMNVSVSAVSVLRQMYDYGLWLWGNPARSVPFCVVKMGLRQPNARPRKGDLPSRDDCVALCDAGLMEVVRPAEKQAFFRLSESGITLAEML